MRLAGTNFLPSVRSGGICRAVQKPGREKEGMCGSFSLGLSALFCPPLAALCPPGLPASSSGWSSIASKVEKKLDSGSCGGRKEPGLGLMKGLSQGRRWQYSGGRLVEKALSFVWAGPPEVGHKYSGLIQFCGSG